MALERAFIPYRAWWSTPFCRWQGGLAGLHSLKLAAQSAGKLLALRGIAPESLDGVTFGITVPQVQSFYGAPWLAGMIGAGGATGPTISQACATSARCLASAALELEHGTRESILVVAADRTSNGPHVYFPNPSGVGGMGESENPVWDNFNLDPHAGGAMLSTAENAAKAAGISREEQDAIALLRFEQYQAALANDRAFQKPWMIPVEIPKGKKQVTIVDADEGIFPTTKEGLAGLRPVVEGGSVTFGTQTHPADGNAGLIVTTRERALQMSAGGPIVQVLGFGEARVAKGLMPMAVVPAARQALQRAGVKVEDCAGINTHNPFAVNDAYFCRETGVKPESMNRYGSSLVWGHPQAPTGLRAMVELFEDLSARGGGIGLFTGCAAGDTAMAVVVRVG